MINCLIIDDEPIARKGLQEHLKQVDFLRLEGECKNAIEAAVIMNETKIDLIFLDIQMPRISGIDFLKTLTAPPLVIFTTAYPEYAIEGYELSVLDYLLKPVSFNRFLKAALKAQDFLQYKQQQVPQDVHDFFFIKANQKIEKINIADMLYAEAMSNYVVLHTRQKKLIVYITFKGLEDQLPAGAFIRIHKSYIVALAAIRSIDSNEVILENQVLPLSKSYRNEVLMTIGKKLFKR